MAALTDSQIREMERETIQLCGIERDTTEPLPPWAAPDTDAARVTYNSFNAHNEFEEWLRAHALSGRAKGAHIPMPYATTVAVAATARALLWGPDRQRYVRNDTRWPAMSKLLSPDLFTEHAKLLAISHRRQMGSVLRYLPEWLASNGLQTAAAAAAIREPPHVGSRVGLTRERCEQYKELAGRLLEYVGDRKITIASLRRMRWGHELWMQREDGKDYVYVLTRIGDKERGWETPSVVQATCAVWGSRPSGIHESQFVFCDAYGTPISRDLLTQITGVLLHTQKRAEE